MSDRAAPVRVLFFAGARDAAGVSQCELEIAPAGERVAELAARLEQRFPALAPYMRSIRLAVNGEYARADARVAPGDEVAVIPPVAGG